MSRRRRESAKMGRGPLAPRRVPPCWAIEAGTPGLSGRFVQPSMRSVSDTASQLDLWQASGGLPTWSSRVSGSQSSWTDATGTGARRTPLRGCPMRSTGQRRSNSTSFGIRKRTSIFPMRAGWSCASGSTNRLIPRLVESRTPWGPEGRSTVLGGRHPAARANREPGTRAGGSEWRSALKQSGLVRGP